MSMPAFDLDELAPVRSRRTRLAIAPLNPDIPRPTSVQITTAMQTVARSGWLEALTPRLPGTRRIRKGGRKATITIDAVLVAALLLAIMERPFILRDLQRLLEYGLDAATRKHLGINKRTVITERKVSRLFNLIIASMDPSVYAHSNQWLFDADAISDYLNLEPGTELDERDIATFADQHLTEHEMRLDHFVRQGLRATHPTTITHRGDYGMDATYIPSWENPKTSRRRTTRITDDGMAQRIPTHPERLADPDARWWRKKDGGWLAGKGQSGLGYAVTTINRIEADYGPNNRGEDIPHLIEHLAVTGAKGSMWRHGVHTVERMLAHHEHEDASAGVPHRERGDMLSDREYSRVRDWQQAMHDFGFTPHFHLAKEQLGHTETLPSGVLIIDGIPYSPGMPTALRDNPSTRIFATRQDRAADAAFYLQRAPYRIRANSGRRQDDGSIKAYCPASNLAGASVECANKPASSKGRTQRIEIGTASSVIGATPLPAICAQSTVTLPFDHVPFWQPHIPGTPEHQWSMHRRSTVEGAYSRIKDEATQSVRRGQIRLMGRAKMTFAILMYAMASNLAEVARWQHRQTNSSEPTTLEVKTRKPRLHTRKRLAAAERRRAWLEAREAAQDPAHAGTLSLDGLVIDIITGEVLNSDDHSSDPPALE